MNQDKNLNAAMNFSFEDLEKMTPVDRLVKALLLLLTAPTNRDGDAAALATKLMAGMNEADVEIAKARASSIYQTI